MKRILLLLPLLLLLTGCVKPLDNIECAIDCNVENVNNVILVVDYKMDYYVNTLGYYAYKFTLLGTKTTFTVDDGSWFYLNRELELGELVLLIKNDSGLNFIPILQKRSD